MLVAVPHYQVACRQQIFHGTAITAVRDAQGLLNINGAEGKIELILVAAKIEIQTERNAGERCEGELPFFKTDLNEITCVFRFVDGDKFLVWK